MSYRPQFAYPPPPANVREESFLYIYDSANVNGLSGTVPANDQLNNIPLPFERDAEFHLRGILVQDGTDASSLQIWFQDSFGNYLQANTITLSTLWSGAGVAVAGKIPVTFEPEVICPAGALVQVYFKNIRGTAQNLPSFNLYGVKWIREAVN